MAGIFPPAGKGGIPPGGNVCNGYTPTHQVVGEGPLYVSPDCSTILTDCQVNAIISEILAAVDLLGFPFNSTRINNLGTALRDRFSEINDEIATRVLRSGDTMTGPLNLFRDPEEPAEAATKRYVDDRDEATLQAARDFATAADEAQQLIIDGKVNRSGDVMEGPFYLVRDPTVDMEAATKRYVDDRDAATLADANAYTDNAISQIFIPDPQMVIIAPDPPVGVAPSTLWWSSTEGTMYILYDDGDSVQWVGVSSATGGGGGVVGNFLPVSGGTLTGPLTLHGEPTAALQAATKQYVDSQIALGGTFIDAPADGELYGRQDNTWVVVPAGGGMGDIDGGIF